MWSLFSPYEIASCEFQILLLISWTIKLLLSPTLSIVDTTLLEEVISIKKAFVNWPHYSIWLFNTLATADSFWWELWCESKIFTFHAQLYVSVHMTITQTSLFHSSNFSPAQSPTNKPNHLSQLSPYILLYQHTFLSTQNRWSCTSCKPLPLGRLPFTAVFQDHPGVRLLCESPNCLPVICCCITNCPKLSDLKQQQIIIS